MDDPGEHSVEYESLAGTMICFPAAEKKMDGDFGLRSGKGDTVEREGPMLAPGALVGPLSRRPQLAKRPKIVSYRHTEQAKGPCLQLRTWDSSPGFVTN